MKMLRNLSFLVMALSALMTPSQVAAREVPMPECGYPSCELQGARCCSPEWYEPETCNLFCLICNKGGGGYIGQTDECETPYGVCECNQG